MKPTKIKKEPDDIISVVWDDSVETKFSIRTLRDECPCAGCKGETVLFKSYIPEDADTTIPGRYELKSILPVGNYAIQISWGDGHDTGIYSFEYLRNLPTCGGSNISGNE